MLVFRKIASNPNYAITTTGKVWSYLSKQWLVPFDRCGYPTVNLHMNHKSRTRPIHRLVLEEFRGPPRAGQVSCHNDGNKQNNRLDNLRWDTHVSNMRDARRLGEWCVGEKHPAAKLTESDVRFVVYAMRTGCITAEQLAPLMGLGHSSTITRIMHRRSWKHLWGVS